MLFLLHPIIVFILAAAFSFSANACPAPGSTIATNTLADLTIRDSPQLCEESGGRCTIRDAIYTAEQCSNGSLLTILLTRNAVYDVTWIAAPDEQLFTRFAIKGANTRVRIEGNRATLRAADPLSSSSGSNRYRVFYISSGATVEISRLTIVNGKVDRQHPNGAGIFNAGDLTLRSVTFLENNNSWGLGGAIYNEGKLRVQQSRFGNLDEDGNAERGNTSLSGGGAIANSSTGDVGSESRSSTIIVAQAVEIKAVHCGMTVAK